MTVMPGIKDVVWMVAGAAALFLCMLVVLHFQEDQDPSAQLALKARRLDLVVQMQADLASASEAEKSAVLATTDRDSQTLVGQARSASAKVDQGRRALEELLTPDTLRGERESLAQFTAAFADLQRIDDELLALAVKNTNVKAYALDFGPAAAALQEMNDALTRLVTANADASEAKAILLLAFGAETSALRIQTLLPPHIAEEDDAKMDELEKAMATDDARARENLTRLAAYPRLRSNVDLGTATAKYAELSDLKAQILALSRENTNVRSLSISLNQKRTAMRVCQAALAALQQAIEAEPIAGITNGARVKPR